MIGALLHGIIAGAGEPGSIPIPVDDNEIFELNTASASGWNNGSVTSDGSVLTYDSASFKNNFYDFTAISGTDYIIYGKIRADRVAGQNINFFLRDGTTNIAGVAIGYDYENSVADVNRTSAFIGGGGGGLRGPDGNWSTSDFEFALQYDSRVGCFNFFVKQSGYWEFYGGATTSLSTINRIYISTGTGTTPDATIYELFVAYPNAVAIGDSITAGHTLYDPIPSFYAGDDNWRSTWMYHANTVFSSLRNDLIINYGVGGESSLAIKNRTSAMLTNTSPRVVFLHASSNDEAAAISQSQRTINIQDTVDLITGAGADCVLLNAVYPNPNNTDYPAITTYMKNWWANERGNVTGTALKIDIMGGSGILDGSDELAAAYTQPDGIHPNVAGFTLIGDLINTY
jgi:lysophospholipase L1-like esterase